MVVGSIIPGMLANEAPPANEGVIAGSVALIFRLFLPSAPVIGKPTLIQLPPANLLAKIWGTLAVAFCAGSCQATQGTAKPVPANPMLGLSATIPCRWSRLMLLGVPAGVHLGGF